MVSPSDFTPDEIYRLRGATIIDILQRLETLESAGGILDTEDPIDTGIVRVRNGLGIKLKRGYIVATTGDTREAAVSTDKYKTDNIFTAVDPDCAVDAGKFAIMLDKINSGTTNGAAAIMGVARTTLDRKQPHHRYADVHTDPAKTHLALESSLWGSALICSDSNTATTGDRPVKVVLTGQVQLGPWIGISDAAILKDAVGDVDFMGETLSVTMIEDVAITKPVIVMRDIENCKYVGTPIGMGGVADCAAIKAAFVPAILEDGDPAEVLAITAGGACRRYPTGLCNEE